MDETSWTAGGKSIASSPIEKLLPTESQTANCWDWEQSKPYLVQDQKLNVSSKRHAVGAERVVGNSLDMRRTAERDLGTRSNMNGHSASFFMEGDKINMTGSHYESGLFSSSLSELFNRKCKSPFPINLLLISWMT